MDTLGDVFHSEFSYIFVSCDINTPIKVLTFSGKESKFRDVLTSHFTRHNLLPEERKGFESYLISQYEESKSKATEEPNAKNGFQLTQDLLDSTIKAADCNYQIIPLTLPTKQTEYLGINCYIDNIGRVKNLPTNARMTRICSTDIRGDCFISKTFDDEVDFKRVNFTLEDYNELMEKPPSPEGRWDASTALTNALTNPTTLPSKAKPVEEVSNKCENCKKEGSDQLVLKLCSRCKKAKYCSVNCQKEDWRFHRRICTV
ncbi:hypothetical protein BEWA_031850 [Theileria equi strain WA]|uniref:MYND-type domain-containing protein n=1 Tax=Theileria equi strain WA TaxID=1537102 RepID=L0AXN7_THEEQ|nr:hypothetical protein BEWA_031850 [Theileria equi strain WA]AFZ80332.1 hypothetical protein BEWA_031850 [Theileria equi strain WA]|eukprot:XP_004829998.1 hypothetical protein BEWA_031850 [Theileria equi strain WA]